MITDTRRQDVDFAADAPDLLVALAEDADTTMHAPHLRVGAIR